MNFSIHSNRFISQKVKIQSLKNSEKTIVPNIYSHLQSTNETQNFKFHDFHQQKALSSCIQDQNFLLIQAYAAPNIDNTQKKKKD